ncbi:MAG: FtsW/RodA/SpoVE family cell cycle protein [Bacteroidales bacterium]|nr:FtsW/RodA/SpoVE family cell cycle protein [Bacteroidales bacterium]
MHEKALKYFKGDRIIWTVIIVLCLFSLLAVSSSTSALAYKNRSGSMFYYFFRQGTFLVLGLGIVYVVHLIPYKYFSRLSQLVLLISIPLLLVTLLFGTSINDAARWLTLPGGLTFQTSDLAKLALVTYLARQLSLKQEKIKSFREAFVPLILPVFVVCGLIIPADLSTALLLFLVSLLLLFIGRVPLRYIMLLSFGMLFLVASLVYVGKMAGWEGRWETAYNRATSFINKEEGNNYQADQSKIAIATGGLLGKGPGNSVQRNFLPHPYSDFIYAIILEEWGFLGGLLIIFLYMYLMFRAGVIVRKSTRTFQAFVVFGLSLLLVLQAMVNMAVAVGIVPVTGQPLPFISMGGTSIMFTALAFGIILSVSNNIESNTSTN